MRQFLDGKVTLHAGDCRECIKALADSSIDSVVCDPPYALVSIVKRFGKPGAAEAKGGVYQRSAAGFMGKTWDNGEAAFAAEFWSEVLRVLKPGGHLLAFSGTRTYHRLAVAVEDAGFEIRDQIGWAYGSGFPKSHDVSKSIDKRGGQKVAWFGPWLKAWREENSIKQSDVAALFPSKTGGKTGCVANWELGLNMPTPEQFNLICSTFGLPFADMAEAERVVVGQQIGTRLAVAPGQGADRSATSIEITASGTAEASVWEGWGTALKPAWEPIVMARKPLSGTVAETVLEHGTGALNIDGARIHADDAQGGEYTVKRLKPGATLDKTGGNWRPEDGGVEYHGNMKAGRWPANIIHDGSAEVIAAFPEAPGAMAATPTRQIAPNAAYGSGRQGGGMEPRNDEGSAARFFYTAKADADDRLGSKHPTVKPLDLMQYLVRLVTPPGGLVLDPFAGTGTTGEAAWREGMRAVLIEREPEYQADIARRMDLAENPTKRAAVAKSKNNLQGAEGTPLFGTDAA